MDTNNIGQSSLSSSSSSLSNLFSDPKNVLIAILVVIVFLSLLGINLLGMIGDFIQNTTGVVSPLIQRILAFVGYTGGAVIDKTTDIAGETAKIGVDIAEGTLDEVGGLLMEASKDKVTPRHKEKIDRILQVKKHEEPPAEPAPSPAENPIQTPSKTGQWCLVGEYKEKRGCIEIGEHDKCLSGQVFPTQKQCLNPVNGPSM